MLSIRVSRQGGGDEQTREYTETSITIGRHPDNDLVLQESTVSRKHARIEVKNGRYHITDLGSAHGLYIDKQRVTDQPLPEHCEIYLNPFILQITAPPPAATEETDPPADEALQTLPGDPAATPEPPAAPPVPIELDIEEADDDDLPTLGEEVPDTIADSDADSDADATPQAAPSDMPAEPAEPDSPDTPDAAPENVVGTIFELNMGPSKSNQTAPGDAILDRPTAELPAPPKPPTAEFKASIEVEVEVDEEPDNDPDAPPSSGMVLAPATAVVPAGEQSQAIDEGTVLEYSAKDVQAYADALDASEVDAAAAAVADADAGLGTLPRHGRPKGDGSVPRTRAHIAGPAAGPGATATPELQTRIPELVAGRDHGRLLALLLGIGLVALTLVPTRGAPVPAFMGGSGIAAFAWLAAFFGGVAAIIGARLVPSALWRGMTVGLAGLVPLLVLLATFDGTEVVAWLDHAELSEGAVALKDRPGGVLLLGWFAHNPVAVWMLALGAVLLAASARIARTWPESRFPRAAGPVAGLLVCAAGLLAAAPAGPIPYAAFFAEGASPMGFVLLTIPLAGLFGLALVAGKGRALTFVPVILLAIGLCSTALLHLRPIPRIIDQTRLAMLPVPMIFLAATGLATAAIAVLTRRRADAQELLDRL